MKCKANIWWRHGGRPVISQVWMLAAWILFGALIILRSTSAAAHPITTQHLQLRTRAWPPTMLVFTRVLDFGLFHFSRSGGRIQPYKNRESHVPLHFRVLTRGQNHNWAWKIIADQSLIPAYRRYTRSRWAIRWSQLFVLLRKEERRMMGHHLPAFQFTIRMVPADHRYAHTCDRFSIHLCYAFAFFRTRDHDDKWWVGGMSIAAMNLSHETTLALIMYGRHGEWVPSSGAVDVWEAQAALFNMYFSAYLDNRFLAPFGGAVILPPMDYGASLRGDSWGTRRFAIGVQLAALALRKTFGGERLICPSDSSGFHKYRKVLYRALHDPHWLDGFRRAAEKSLSAPYPDHSNLVLLLPRGRQVVAPVKYFGSASGADVSLDFELPFRMFRHHGTAADRELSRICSLYR